MPEELQKKVLATARFESLRNRHPALWGETEVAEYNSVVGWLEEAYTLDFSMFRVSPDRLKPRRTGRAPYSTKQYAGTSYVQRQIEGLHLHLQRLDSDPPQRARNKSAPALEKVQAPEKSIEGTESQGYRQDLTIPGPDDSELRISSGDVYVCNIWNGGLISVQQLRMETTTVRTFDSRKLAFREAIIFKVRLAMIPKLPPGEVTKSILFIRFEGDYLGCGDTKGVHQLPWPNGDQSRVRRWLVSMRIVGLSREWPITLDLRWTPGNRFLQLKHCPDETGVPDGAFSGPGLPAGQKVETESKRGDLLENLLPDDPNYEAAKKFYLEAWADSHALVAGALADGILLSDYIAGNARTYEQGAEMLVAFEDVSPTAIPRKCRELEKLAKAFIRKFRRKLLPETKRLGKAYVNFAVEEFSRRINEIAARSKERILRRELGRDATNREKERAIHDLDRHLEDARSSEQNSKLQNATTPKVPSLAKSLSKRDQDIHDAVGGSNFRSLTNSEIMHDRNLGRKLKKDHKLKPGTDATKARLDRIRRAKGYPLSRAITNKRSTHN